MPHVCAKLLFMYAQPYAVQLLCMGTLLVHIVPQPEQRKSVLWCRSPPVPAHRDKALARFCEGGKQGKPASRVCPWR